MIFKQFLLALMDITNYVQFIYMYMYYTPEGSTLLKKLQ